MRIFITSAELAYKTMTCACYDSVLVIDAHDAVVHDSSHHVEHETFYFNEQSGKQTCLVYGSPATSTIFYVLNIENRIQK